MPIRSRNIATDAGIRGTQLLGNDLTALQIGAGGVDTEELATNAVTTIKITNLSVTSPKLAANGVSTAAITNLSVTSPKLAANAVSTAAITNLSVTSPKLAVNGVSTAAVTNNAITVPKLGTKYHASGVTVSGVDRIVSGIGGITTMLSAVAVLGSAPTLSNSWAAITALAGGSFTIHAYKPTGAGDVTPINATGAKTYRFIAMGT